MDLQKVLQFVGTYAKDYGERFFHVLTEPAQLLENGSRSEGTDRTALSIFLVASILLGATIGSLIPDRPKLQDRAIIAAVVMCLWLFLSLVVHVVCRLMKGKASAMMTFSAMTQILAMAYVISNFAALLYTACRKAYPRFDVFAHESLFATPGGMLFAIQFTVLLIYIPLTLSSAHEFRGFKRLIAALIGAGCAILFGYPIFALGGC
jgi:hypothetical protein